MMMKQAPRREEKNAPGEFFFVRLNYRQCSCTEFYLYLYTGLYMTCLYKYEGTQGEGLEVMQALRDVYTYILYIYILCSNRGI